MIMLKRLYAKFVVLRAMWRAGQRGWCWRSLWRVW